MKTRITMNLSDQEAYNMLRYSAVYQKVWDTWNDCRVIYRGCEELTAEDKLDRMYQLVCDLSAVVCEDECEPGEEEDEL